MRKVLLPALLFGAVLLAACSPNAAEAPRQKVSGPPMEGCQVVNAVPKPDPTLEALIPPVSEGDHIEGNKAARVTFIEYSDYQ